MTRPHEATLQQLIADVREELVIFPYPKTDEGRLLLQQLVERGPQMDNGEHDWQYLCSVDYDKWAKTDIWERHMKGQG